RIGVLINAGLRDDIAHLAITGADGVGLFRTEFQFLVSATLPQRERQLRLYRDVLDAAGEKPVIFRTLDIGGDKSLPYLREDGPGEENPAMGWRALRLALERDGLLKVQARALIEAAAGRTLNVMFPMVAEPWEFDAARQVFEEQLEFLKGRKKILPDRIRYGAMLEVPALAETLDILGPKLDFLSIGTNDLTQFLFAADRAHPRLAERYDWLSIAILRFLDRVVRTCADYQVPVGVCGEMGGRTLEAMALVGLGIRRLSITPASVGPVKAMIRAVDAAELQALMRELLDGGVRDIRASLTQWAVERNIELG
ncbi:MAG: peptidase, partial [Alphaproteobacteria bacterium]|nr:peptidase [Alphaproteobacteria bacterium]